MEEAAPTRLRCGDDAAGTAGEEKVGFLFFSPFFPFQVGFGLCPRSMEEDDENFGIGFGLKSI